MLGHVDNRRRRIVAIDDGNSTRSIVGHPWAGSGSNWSGDVADGLMLLLRLSVVGRYTGGSTRWVEGVTTAVVAGCCRWFRGEDGSGVAGAPGWGDVDFLGGYGAVHADLTGGNVE